MAAGRQAPWVTGWGAVNLLLVAARGPQDSVVRLLVEAREQPGLAAARQRLAAANASATVRLTFDGLVVPEERYVAAGRSTRSASSRRGCGPTGRSPWAWQPLLRADRASALDDELSRCRAELDAAGTGTMPAARPGRRVRRARRPDLAVTRGSASALAGDRPTGSPARPRSCSCSGAGQQSGKHCSTGSRTAGSRALNHQWPVAGPDLVCLRPVCGVA